jgi:hypothetical protein
VDVNGIDISAKEVPYHCLKGAAKRYFITYSKAGVNGSPKQMVAQNGHALGIIATH